MTFVGDNCNVCISRDAYSCKHVAVDGVMKESFCDYQFDKGLFCDSCNCVLLSLVLWCVCAVADGSRGVRGVQMHSPFEGLPLRVLSKSAQM